MNRLFAISLAALMSSSLSAQDIKHYFTKSPSALFHPIDSLDRTQMCNLMDKGNSTGVITMFGDSVKMHKLTDSFIAFSHSNVDIQIKLSDDVIVIVRTYGKESRNSEVSFYDTSWKQKSSWIYGSVHSKQMPSDKKIYEALIVKPDTMSNDEFERLQLYFDPMFVTAELSADSDDITLKAECPLLTDEEKTKLEAVIKQKTFKWTNGKFK